MTHLKVGEDQFWYQDKGHRVNEPQSSRERDSKEREEPKSGYLGDAGYPVRYVVLGIHRAIKPSEVFGSVL